MAMVVVRKGKFNSRFSPRYLSQIERNPVFPATSPKDTEFPLNSK